MQPYGARIREIDLPARVIAGADRDRAVGEINGRERLRIPHGSRLEVHPGDPKEPAALDVRLTFHDETEGFAVTAPRQMQGGPRLESAARDARQLACGAALETPDDRGRQLRRRLRRHQIPATTDTHRTLRFGERVATGALYFDGRSIVLEEQDVGSRYAERAPRDQKRVIGVVAWSDDSPSDECAACGIEARPRRGHAR
jgi:hypothetical protein